MQHKICAGEEGYLCEPGEGPILGESSDDDEDMGLVNGLMDPLEDQNKLRELMFETIKEAIRPYDFETNDWCVLAGCTNSEDDSQSFKNVIQVERKMTKYGHVESSEETQSEIGGCVKVKGI